MNNSFLEGTVKRTAHYMYFEVQSYSSQSRITEHRADCIRVPYMYCVQGTEHTGMLNVFEAMAE